MYMIKEATIEDITYITHIYNEGIEDRIATLETTPKTIEYMSNWFLNRKKSHKVLIIKNENNIVHGWASLNSFDSRCSYSGVVDLSIYIERGMRGRGLGRLLLEEVIKEGKKQGFNKIILNTLEKNRQAKRLYESLGFRNVGVYEKHGILDDEFIDIRIMEKLL